MACFLVSAAEAAVVAGIEKAQEKKEKQADEAGVKVEKSEAIPFSRKLKWLTFMLCGGAVLLMFEHIWHGEVVPWPPFLTAMADAADTAEMLREMATVGVTMAILVTVVWLGMCLAADAIMKRSARLSEQKTM